MQLKRHHSGHFRYVMTAGFILMVLLSVLHGREKPDDIHPLFSGGGRLELPASFRQWKLLGVAIAPDKLSNGRALPELHFLYMEPGAFQHYLQTGKFREGTMLAKEVIGTESRETPTGQGYFPGESKGLGISLKSRRRHPGSPDNWGFYYFGSEPPYAADAELQPEEACAGCHRAGERELVFGQYYPVLALPGPE